MLKCIEYRVVKFSNIFKRLNIIKIYYAKDKVVSYKIFRSQKVVDFFPYKIFRSQKFVKLFPYKIFRSRKVVDFITYKIFRSREL